MLCHHPAFSDLANSIITQHNLSGQILFSHGMFGSHLACSAITWHALSAPGMFFSDLACSVLIWHVLSSPAMLCLRLTFSVTAWHAPLSSGMLCSALACILFSPAMLRSHLTKSRITKHTLSPRDLSVLTWHTLSDPGRCYGTRSGTFWGGNHTDRNLF
jgi:hypothetical protein